METHDISLAMDHVQSREVVMPIDPLPPSGPNDAVVCESAIWHLLAPGATTDVSTDVHRLKRMPERAIARGGSRERQAISSTDGAPMHGARQRRPSNADQLGMAGGPSGPATNAVYFAEEMESTWIVLVLVSSVPTIFTFCPANFSGVR